MGGCWAMPDVQPPMGLLYAGPGGVVTMLNRWQPPAWARAPAAAVRPPGARISLSFTVVPLPCICPC